MREDFTCGCGLYVHPSRRNPKAIHIPGCAYAPVSDATRQLRDLFDRLRCWEPHKSGFGSCTCTTNDVIEELQLWIEAALTAAKSQMLESVRGSLVSYPGGGGDIGVMKEVERLVSAAEAKGRSDMAREIAGEIRNEADPLIGYEGVLMRRLAARIEAKR